jgi:hypothetical protein
MPLVFSRRNSAVEQAQPETSRTTWGRHVAPSAGGSYRYIGGFNQSLVWYFQ